MATAAATRRQLLELKQQVRRKQEAERKYYRASIESLDRAAASADYTEQRQAMLEKTRSDAKALIDKQGQVERALLGSQIASAANELAASLNASAEFRRVQRDKLAKALATLDDLDETYGALEKSLVQLSTPTDHSGQLATFIIKAGLEFKKLQDEAKQSEAKPSDK